MTRGIWSVLAGGLLALAISPAARAESPDLGTYNAFGKLDGITRIVDDGVDRLLKDDRIKSYFASANIPRLKQLLSQQFCALLNGPCTYQGRDMKETHASMGLHNADFNALAEDFQLAMDDFKVPFREQNKLLALLAPMQHDIVRK
jgi:hemoglobin